MLSSIFFQAAQVNPDIMTEEDLNHFEAQSKIRLPPDYRDFCQIFGSGMFGDYMRIRCPYIQEQEEKITLIREAIVSPSEGVLSTENQSLIQDLINHSFIFGDNHNSEYVLWNLNTYREDDKSYDIYLMTLYPINSYFLCRSFFEFIRDYCLNIKMLEIFPQAEVSLLEIVHPTFTQFSNLKDFYEEEPQGLSISIWKRNVENGIVLNLAHQYENQNQFSKALGLYLQHNVLVEHRNVELVRLNNAFRRVLKSLGSRRFKEICQLFYNSKHCGLIISQINDPYQYSEDTRMEGEHYMNFQDYLKNAYSLEIHTSNLNIFQNYLEDIVTLEEQISNSNLEPPEELSLLIAEKIPEVDTDFQRILENYFCSLNIL